MQEKSVSMIVVAAGKGARAGGRIPKQYQTIAGKTILRHTLDALIRSYPFTEIVCVINPEDNHLYEKSVEGLSLSPAVKGGNTRQESSFNGLKALTAKCDLVMIHDAARPFVSDNLIKELIDSKASATIPGISVTDTVKRADPQMNIIETVNREGLYSVQTPQAFDYHMLLKAHQSLTTASFTDDSMIMETIGEGVTIIEGDEANFKVTHPEDFKKAEMTIMNRLADIRTGHGYDVHRFEEGSSVILCGVEIPHTHRLKGHSDADVALHALTDAIFSSIAAGDIGCHFPPTDPQWQGAASSIFLEKACEMVKDKGGIISNIVVTLICERPKISLHQEAMRMKLSEITGLCKERISVQATTTEKLGFTGRNEGIAAEALATVRLPL
ncbi:bifunctional 2-C-methyl-D-erythritol 4-phosphate cytidylyltransferase/2-C-methyl-D-erythritol 2,4-cyclodiphosphate synthase [Temperatibacter marinus]|uniref:Bifunctional enzyme IspD/IspF n=1 Tax=Temperatibacter marinus TaxID=1456591 RepID=A0AA52ECN2_9PROT|nr:bifunctional 2-C-methyl-D-erythritol 4-phosphate cytidylyltransferase/2-C-methyl-D-erythritol 2,4-cyclodiphosphate synthase [Temperatibacter marinus]WND02326.1 bifunctional 2-C-methyl-D-erythritol 4-phosphate cytidylyltransferase/2-C-methyl-D-erythritol 2,4-cyclodiphosphate synthase [Temperatibacter marinus]